MPQTTNLYLKKFFSHIKRHKNYVLLSILLIIHTTGTLIWLSKDNLPPHWDQLLHLTNTLHYTNLLHEKNLIAFLVGAYTYYPPLLYQTTSIFWLLFGPVSWAPHLITILLTWGTTVLTYLLGKKLFSSRVGIIAAGVTLFLPITTSFSKDYMLDIPLTFFFLLATYLLLENPYISTKKAIFTGAILACGMLTKWTFAAFIILPFLLTTVQSFHSAEKTKAWLKNTSTMALTVLLLAAPWYITHLSEFLRDAQFNAFIVPKAEHDPVPGSAVYFLYYLSVILNEYLYLPLFTLLVIGVAKLRRSKQKKATILSLGTLACTYFLFTLISNKDPRYLFPCIPFFALIIAFAINSIPHRGKKLAVLTCISIFLLIQFLGNTIDLNYFSTKIAIASPTRYIAFFTPADAPEYFKEKQILDAPILGEITFYNPFSYFSHLPRQENWHIKEIIADWVNNDNITIDVDNDIFFNKTLLLYEAEQQHKIVKEPSVNTPATRLICAQSRCPELPNCTPYLLPNNKTILSCPL
ncbi:MAG: glycosyltransferase family 39 protein [bacterium]